MALLQVNFFAESLGLSTAMNVLLPQSTSAAQVGMTGSTVRDTYPVLYLLHGWSDDETIWLRRTSIERYAAAAGIAVVMPRVDLSFYQNTVTGMHYWTFIHEELPALCKAWFPLSSKREETYVAGLSMGGYGAMRLGLACPEKFGAVASLSGAMNVVRIAAGKSSNSLVTPPKISAIWGSDPAISGTEADLFHLAAHLKDSHKQAPRMYMCCGTEDFLYNENLLFRDYLRSLGFGVTYDEGPEAHVWGYWDRQIQKVLEWLTATQTPH